MPAERGYEQQLGPAAPVAAPRADASAFGGALGAGISGIADSLHRDNMQVRALERQQTADQEAAAFSARFAQAREAADQASVDARTSAAPGGAGHAEAMRKWWTDQADGLLDGITDDRVRRSAQTQLTEFGTRFDASEYQWQAGQAVGKVVTDKGKEIAAASNRARRLPDLAAFGEEFSFFRQGIEAMTGVPADVREKLLREGEQSITVGFFNGMIDRNPASVAKVLDSGQFDAILSPEQMEHLRRGAEIQVRRNDGAAKAEVAYALKMRKQELAARRAELDQGAGKPEDWLDLSRDLEAVGDKAGAITARAGGVNMAAAIGFRGETPTQLDSRIAQLTAKKNAGGLTVDEAATLAGTIKVRGQLAGMLGQPGGPLLGLEFATGKPTAPLNPADPASMRSRAAQAKAAAAYYSRPSPEPLLQNDLPMFRDLVAGGAQQKLQALQMIQSFGDPQVIRAAAAQVTGSNDGTFRIASQLPPSVARSVLMGDDTLKTAPQVIKPRPGQRGPKEDFGAWFGPNRLLTYVGGSYSNDIFEAARALYGQRAAEAGLEHYDSGRFAEAVETVLGKMPGPDGPTGGIARHGAGMVLVPQGMKPDALLQRFARASADDYARASGGRVPHWADGTPLTRSELVRALPTALDGNGHYGFRGQNNQLISDDHGNPYVVDIRRLGQ